eukprot:PITA_06574
MPTPKPKIFWLLWVILGLIIHAYAEDYTIGVAYGQFGDNLPSVQESIDLIQRLKVGRVKIYSTNPVILKALSNTGIKVSVMVRNEDIAGLSASQSVADKWVNDNIVPFYPATEINIILVGNEILTDYSNKQTWYQLVPAMQSIWQALVNYNLDHINVGTPLAMDMLGSSVPISAFPPSAGTFRDDIAETVMKPMLEFLHRTNSYFFMDVYSYFPYLFDPEDISLEYSNFGEHDKNYTDPNGLVYTNVLDQQLDAVVAAMSKLGYDDIKLAIAETGWPNAGDISQLGANINYAALYNRRVIRRMVADPPLGTPRRPNQFIPTYIFLLYDEDKKSGPGTERHWGFVYPNGTLMYEIDLTGKLQDSDYGPLPPPPPPYKGKLWCVADPTADVYALPSAIDSACSQGDSTCDAIQPGEPCYEPNTVIDHASYAFNSNWQRSKNFYSGCDFNKTAKLVTEDPSHGNCIYEFVDCVQKSVLC